MSMEQSAESEEKYNDSRSPHHHPHTKPLNPYYYGRADI